MRTQIEGVGELSNSLLYELEEGCEEFLASVKRALHRFRHDPEDFDLNISFDVSVDLVKKVEVKDKLAVQLHNTVNNLYDGDHRGRR
jgi:hypothetical protein